jgi:hypothetical protein
MPTQKVKRKTNQYLKKDEHHKAQALSRDLFICNEKRRTQLNHQSSASDEGSSSRQVSWVCSMTEDFVRDMSVCPVNLRCLKNAWVPLKIKLTTLGSKLSYSIMGLSLCHPSYEGPFAHLHLTDCIFTIFNCSGFQLCLKERVGYTFY